MLTPGRLHAELGIDLHESGELERAAWSFEQSARKDGGCGAGMLMYGCVKAILSALARADAISLCSLTLRHGWVRSLFPLSA